VFGQRDHPYPALCAAIHVMTLVVGLSLLLTGCGIPFVPFAGNEDPLALTVRDGEVVFHWCGFETDFYSYLLIEYAVWTPDREDGLGAEGAGEFRSRGRQRCSSLQEPKRTISAGSGQYTISPTSKPFANEHGCIHLGRFRKSRARCAVLQPLPEYRWTRLRPAPAAAPRCCL
jgi:hypothetical protein